MTAVSPFRFFVMVGLHSPFMLLALGVAAVSGIAMVMVDPSRGAEAVTPLALVQMFAVSSGFAVPARRGHLDLLLTGGADRLWIAVTHLTISIAPGIVAWVFVGIAEVFASRSLSPKAFASGTVLALGVISILAWAITVAMPRLSGAIAWLLAMSVLFVSGFDRGAVLTSVLCPFVLIGGDALSNQFTVSMSSIGLAIAGALTAIAWVARVDVPLESAQ